MVCLKKGQFRMSFGMIFSILLIVAFVIVAFIAIRTFIGVKCSTDQGLFIKELQDDIDKIWRGAGSSEIYEGRIGSCKVNYVCFWDVDSASKGSYVSFLEGKEGFSRFDGNEGSHNLYFYPRTEADIDSVLIKHINVSAISLERDNPVCYKQEEGKFSIPLRKNLNEALVKVS